MSKFVGSLVGRLTRDSELRYTPSGSAVLNFSVAVSDGYGENKSTIFVDCAVFGKRAESLQPHLTKGKPVFVSGQVKQDTWDDKKTGEKRTKWHIFANDVEFVGDSGKGEGKQESRADMPHVAAPSPTPRDSAPPAPDTDDVPF